MKSFEQSVFIRARQEYWKRMVKRYHPEIPVIPQDETTLQTNFIVSSQGSGSTFAVFEDEGDTGYLYLFSYEDEQVLRCVHVYDRGPNLEVNVDDVAVKWSRDLTKCGATIFGEMHAVIDTLKQSEIRAWLDDSASPGIIDSDWLLGFD